MKEEVDKERNVRRIEGGARTRALTGESRAYLESVSHRTDTITKSRNVNRARNPKEERNFRSHDAGIKCLGREPATSCFEMESIRAALINLSTCKIKNKRSERYPKKKKG